MVRDSEQTAVRNGDHYVINGMKRFITGGDSADFFKVTCVTDPEKGARGVSCILVDADTPGVTVLRRQETMMDDQPCEIAFDDARVPVENLIGKEGDGFKMAQHWITIGRVRHGAGALGVMERCLEMSASYAQQRKTFGRPSRTGRRCNGRWSIFTPICKPCGRSSTTQRRSSTREKIFAGTPIFVSI